MRGGRRRGKVGADHRPAGTSAPGHTRLAKPRRAGPGRGLHIDDWGARKLSELARDPRFKDRSLVCAFEGADAAGKGGAIRRIAASLDARQYQVIPVAAPTEEERAQPYLWRF